MAQAIREVVSSAILFEVSDPRVRAVTVLGAEVSHDMRQATVLVSIMGTETEQNLAMRGLQHASGFLQAKMAARLQTRFTPVLSFKRDDSVKKSIELTKLIDETIAADRKLDPAAAVESPPPGEDSEPAEDEN
jgi:ribosome-binding factor A